MNFEYSFEKDTWLKENRNISFEDVIVAMESGGLLDEGPHPNRILYPHQRIFYVKIRDCVYRVPYVEAGTVVFLKTIYPSRKATQKYLSH